MRIRLVGPCSLDRFLGAAPQPHRPCFTRFLLHLYHLPCPYYLRLVSYRQPRFFFWRLPS